MQSHRRPQLRSGTLANWRQGESPAARRSVRAEARRRYLRQAAGFTIVELLAIIIILVILTSIGVVVGGSLFDQSQVDQTRVILQQGIGANTEYQARTGIIVNHGDTGSIDWSQARSRNAPGATGSAVIGNPHATIERYVSAMLSLPETETMIRASADRLRDTDGDGFLELVDAWEKPIEYRSGADASATPVLPNHPRPFLASAGVDEQWGSDPNPNLADEARGAAADNIYSFQLGE